MMTFESVASLRPQPYGLPLRGRATKIDGFKAKRNEWQVATQNRTPDRQTPSYFHRLVVPEWGKAHNLDVYEASVDESLKINRQFLSAFDEKQENQE